MLPEVEPPRFVDHALVRAGDEVEGYSGERDVSDIRKEGARHVVAQRVQMAKTLVALDLTAQIYDYALATADTTKRRMYRRLAAGGRGEECQIALEALFQSLMAQYDTHLRGIVEVGVTGVARMVHSDVAGEPSRRGWFW